MTINTEGARKALDSYGNYADLEEQMTDLLTDLFHVAHVEGFGYETILEKATEHYNEEIEQAAYEAAPIGLGSYVQDNQHGYRGRVNAVHHYCELPENETWVAGQTPAILEGAKEPLYLWYSVLVHGGGSVLRPQYALDLIEPIVPFNNPYKHNYWPGED